jgi:hypothetical protein
MSAQARAGAAFDLIAYSLDHGHRGGQSAIA